MLLLQASVVLISVECKEVWRFLGKSNSSKQPSIIFGWSRDNNSSSQRGQKRTIGIGGESLRFTFVMSQPRLAHHSSWVVSFQSLDQPVFKKMTSSFESRYPRHVSAVCQNLWIFITPWESNLWLRKWAECLSCKHTQPCFLLQTCSGLYLQLSLVRVACKNFDISWHSTFFKSKWDHLCFLRRLNWKTDWKQNPRNVIHPFFEFLSFSDSDLYVPSGATMEQKMKLENSRTKIAPLETKVGICRLKRPSRKKIPPLCSLLVNLPLAFQPFSSLVCP